MEVVTARTPLPAMLEETRPRLKVPLPPHIPHPHLTATPILIAPVHPNLLPLRASLLKYRVLPLAPLRLVLPLAQLQLPRARVPPLLVP